MGVSRIYIIIDLKSFYASVECVERGLDPMLADLVVADKERSVNTICLAVSAHLKTRGVKNRCRIRDIPAQIDYICAIPRMQTYINYSAKIYAIYLRYFDEKDIHVYSVDEAFIDATEYLHLYHKTPKEMALFLMERVRQETGLRSTAGVGTNLYLAKVALDILSKHSPEFIGILDEQRYQKLLWDHRPLLDFWQIGAGKAARLARKGIYTQRQITEAPEEELYEMFGRDAELIIDHAWGRESCTMADIKQYVPKSRSLSLGQVLMRDYSTKEALTVFKEMADQLCLDMTEKRVVTGHLGMYIGYAKAETMPASSGTIPLPRPCNATDIILPRTVQLYSAIVRPDCPIRRVGIFCGILPEESVEYQQLSLFEPDYTDTLAENQSLQDTVNEIHRRYGKNALLKGMDLLPEATRKIRNGQIGGHRSGEKA